MKLAKHLDQNIYTCQLFVCVVLCNEPIKNNSRIYIVATFSHNSTLSLMNNRAWKIFH